jgi:acylphosphatase
MNDGVTVHVLIEGRVQGVWYRGWTVAEAGRRSLRGWVRNLSDGRVEAVFHGPRTEVDAMVDACWQGPPAAHVRRIAVAPCPDAVGPGFHQRPTV